MPFVRSKAGAIVALIAPLVLLGRASAPDLVASPLRALVRLTFDSDEERDAAEHAADRVVVGKLPGLVHAPEAKRLNRGPDLRSGADRRLHERRFESFVSHSKRLHRRQRAPPPHFAVRALDPCRP